MPIDAQGIWTPSIYPKQQELLKECCPGPQNMVLVNGPRLSGKTVGCHHVAAQHAYDTDRGNICILTITQSVGVDSGVWQHLTEIFLPEWIDEGNFGMEWHRRPYTQSVTKKPACSVINRYGTVTRFSLESLKNEDEVEARFKGKAYSMIWVNELSKFKKRKTFDTLKLCLRMPHLNLQQHLFLADTNPDLDLGEQSWIYQLWYDFKDGGPEVWDRIYPGVDPVILEPLRDCLKRIEFTVDDNLSLDTLRKRQLMADFAHDQDLLAAYYYGKWVTASTDALFFKVFRPDIHVVGEIESATNPEPETLVPEPNCFELVMGIDPGGTNCAAAIMEKTYRKEDRYKKILGEVAQTLVDGTEEVDVPVIKVLDELCVVDADFNLEDFVEELVRKLEYWEDLMERPGRVVWRHWSDRSAFDMKVPFSDRYWHQHIFQASGGKISLMAAERGKGSVKARIDLFRKLLFEQRIFFSRTNCPQSINMCKSLKAGKSMVAPIQKGSPHKHIFDAITYGVASELYDELNREIMMNLRKMRHSKNESTVVSIGV